MDLIETVVPFTKRLWVRIAAIAGVSLIALALTPLVGDLLPERLVAWVGQGAVDQILQTLAGSMLAATVFTLSVMVTLHRAVAGSWTPRAHRLMVQDNVTLNAVSVFIGGWIYALAALALREAGLIAKTDSAVLFLTTLMVLGLLIAVLVRWAVHLSSLGSLEETGDLVERAARDAIRARVEAPFLGGSPLTEETAVPAGHRTVTAAVTGWVSRIDMDALSEAAEERGVPVYVLALPGRFVAAGGAIGMAEGDEMADALRRAVEVAELRDFRQDPRFGVVTLSEIAQRALSPGINDPGTAIEIVGRLLRTILDWQPERTVAPTHPLVFVPPLDPATFVEDGLAPVARDGAGFVEVLEHVLKALVRLSEHPDERMAAAARRQIGIAMRRAERGLDEETDLARLRALIPPAARAA